MDSDGDGIRDESDAFPGDPSEWADSDGDGVGDNGDAFPMDPSEWADSDGDGVGNNNDAFPTDPTEWADSDSDRVGDNRDNCPGTANENQADWDGDSLGDVCDPLDHETPIVFVHGYNFRSTSDASKWNTPKMAFQQRGWVGPLHAWGFYACDYGFDRHMSDYGSHASHFQDFHGNLNGEMDSYCQGHSDGHTVETNIHHLAHHLAWGLNDEYDGCVNIVAHSMGGLIVRYMASQLGSADFPESLCIGHVVTLGTPHAGTEGWGIPDRQVELMYPQSGLIQWLGEHANPPVGEAYWLLIGSQGDWVVGEGSATSMGAHAFVIYDEVAHAATGNYLDTALRADPAALQYADHSTEFAYQRATGPWPIPLAVEFIASSGLPS